MNPPDASERFVFQDPHGHRWPRLRRVLLVWGVLAMLGVIWFFQSVFVRPELKLPTSIRSLKGQLHAAINATERKPDDPNAINWQKYYATSQAGMERLARIRAQLRKGPQKTTEIRLGLYVDWDENSFASLEEHASSLTHLAPEWLTLVETDSKLVYDPDPKIAHFAAAHGLTTMPLLRNLQNDEWQPEAVENLANGSADQRAKFIAALVADLKDAKAGGVIIDWELVDPAYGEKKAEGRKDAYTGLLTEMADGLHDAGLELWFLVSPGDAFETFDLEALAEIVDRFVALLSDENSDSDKPGPISSLEWLEGWLKVIDNTGNPDQWIIALGAYAYDWNETTQKTETISFKDAMSRASYAGVDREGRTVEVGAPAYNGVFSYSEAGGDHTVSFLDGVSFFNQLRAVRRGGFAGVGISRLGSEDPALWDLLDAGERPGSGALVALGKLRANETITHVGRGEIVTMDDTKDDGERRLAFDKDGCLTASYVDFPTYPILYHQGAGGEHEVAITFDDGPDPEWTPRVLEILKARGVKAVFFLIGKNAEDYPGLVARIFAEGHEIGNHTYYHANLAIMSQARMRLELNMTQRLIESITGHSTTLFRPPYNADSTPTSIEELTPLKLAQDELGYTVVLEKVDPQDWARPGADVIVQRVKDLRDEGNLVLLHDAGGDRSQTVEALPQIIDYLQTRGDRIVSLSELLHIPRDDLMPPVTSDQHQVERFVSGTGFRLWHAVVEFFWAFLIFATVLVVLRTLLVAWLAHLHHRRGRKFAPRAGPALSVIIAAYNEGRVIAKTLQSLLETDYEGEFEVLVVDDGSQDDTAAEVERVAAAHPQIRLLRQPNGGKATALRQGVAQARHEFLVFLDADTLFERGTLRALVAPFANPLVGAVSGNARVGNLRSFVARCQSLEYICGFNLDRRAYTVWNCITVVPGAVSALRRSAVAAAGGFSHDTLAEDTDLTLTLHRLGYRIEYAPDAVAWTEAPETWSTLAKQRFRWAFGTMQCLWKHRDLVFNPRFGALGWFSLPGIWFFQILLVALTPVVDGVLLVSLFVGHGTALWYYFVVFLALDLFLAMLACYMEDEPWPRAFTIVPMRLAYRPLLAWVIWKAIFRALKGALVGWGKLERTGAVPSRAS
jgi:cellulose synthase/poly-beta-1,6-N-acetylglucosamine synthase-like glycosyltransferase/peptidoglycan/xylan/chitin deacetylase (PgdA/CDA1 family)/spore germination protein YaaH